MRFILAFKRLKPIHLEKRQVCVTYLKNAVELRRSSFFEVGKKGTRTSAVLAVPKLISFL